MLENMRSVPFLKYYNSGSVHWPINAIVLSVGNGTVQEHLVDWHSLHEGGGILTMKLWHPQVSTLNENWHQFCNILEL